MPTLYANLNVQEKVALLQLLDEAIKPYEMFLYHPHYPLQEKSDFILALGAINAVLYDLDIELRFDEIITWWVGKTRIQTGSMIVAMDSSLEMSHFKAPAKAEEVLYLRPLQATIEKFC